MAWGPHPDLSGWLTFANLFFCGQFLDGWYEAVMTPAIARAKKDRYKTDRIIDDPTDNKFLASALEGRADYILSRDPHLRNLKHYQGIQIVDATTFLNKINVD